MKTSLIGLSLIGIALVAATAIHLRSRKEQDATTLVIEPASDAQFARSAQLEVHCEEPLQVVPERPDEPAHAGVVIPAPSAAAFDRAANAAPRPTPFSQAIATLVAPEASFQQKHEAWRQLQDASQLDQVIETLQQGAADHPMAAAYPAALGQAQLYKAGAVSRNGGTISEMGILGMQADENFDAALKLDPANWEAQFFKAASMSHWPLELNKGDEVVQRLSRLIDQQDRMTPQPQFAQTYVVLGDQYQKMGQPDHATATWLIGAQKFPRNQELQLKIRGN